MSSLENVGNESIQFLAFANTFVSKNGKTLLLCCNAICGRSNLIILSLFLDTSPSPTLWVGTSCGSVIVVSLTMPDNDNRELCLQSVLATPSSTYSMNG